MERKSRYRIQAQGEEYAHRRIRQFSDEQKLFLKYSAELSRQLILSPMEIPEDFPLDLREAITNHWEAYVHFLEGASGEEKLAIQFAERNAKYYDQTFASEVRELRRDIKQGKAGDSFLGKGSNGQVYSLEKDGVEYAVKFNSSINQSNFELRALLLAKGIPKVAQLVAYSFEDHAVVMERLPGKDVTQLPSGILEKATERQMVELVRSVQQLADRGLVIDPKPSNFLYDRKNGFSVLDYHIAHEHSSKKAEQVMSLRYALTWQPNDFSYPDHDDPELKKKIRQEAINKQREYLPRLLRFVIVLEDRFPEIIQSWRWHRKRMKSDPKRNGGEFLRKDELVMSNPGVAGYVHQLEEIGDGWVFE